MVILEAPDAHLLCEHLKQHEIYTDSRQNRYLRMAPFMWNTEAELTRAFDRIVQAVDSGSYRTADVASSAPGPVT
jgi:kynureninase